MFSVRFPVSGLLIVLGMGALTQAVEPSTRPNPPSSEKAGAAVGPVQSARRLIGVTLKSRQGEVFGKIQDVGLDIGNGTVANVFVMSPDKSGKADTVTVPIQALTWADKSHDAVIETSVASEAKEPADPDTKSQVILLSSRAKIPVHNSQGAELGHIVDFGLESQKGLIAFAVLVRDADADKSAATRYPIPLSAFVVEQDGKKWILALPDDVLAATPTFKHDAWPTTISGAWTEYVHVRYGRSPFGGVQQRSKAPAGK